VRPYLDADVATRMVAAHYDEPGLAAAVQVQYGQYELERAGF
jgi:hypothetical protein